MTSADADPYQPPVAATHVDSSAPPSRKTPVYVAVITGVVGVVAYQFIISDERTLPNGVQVVTAHLEIAVLSALLSMASVISLLVLRRRSRGELRFWQSAVLWLVVVAAAAPCVLAIGNHIVPFTMHFLR